MLSRALYARGLPRPAAVATAIGWVTVSVAASRWPPGCRHGRRLLALALANSIGMLVLGALLVLAVHRRAGAAALAGFTRALLVGLTAGAAAAAAGWAVADALSGGSAAGKPDRPLARHASPASWWCWCSSRSRTHWTGTTCDRRWRRSAAGYAASRGALLCIHTRIT